MFDWTDDSALYQVRYPETESGESATRYLQARLQGWQRKQANDLANGKGVDA